ncbi:MAG: ribbon-helix-helix domain-containing protein [Candidatus Korarchaeum sp.]|nr:ribbon-helix-helix domain-containing protein [Candidatus Korarchaeum sp.]MDW8035210.1 ribbon-helix-helix domain-containing protein [Candidatus Korarchaeum sp.]
MKRRFGISIPEELLEMLDIISRELMVSRSSLIEELIRDVIEERSHLFKPHRCRGVLIVISRVPEGASRVLEKYGSCIVSRSHHHSEGRCIDVSFVEADSTEVINLRRELKRVRGVSERYLPLTCIS